MRQTDYNLGAARRRKKRKATTVLAAIAYEAPPAILFKALQNHKRARNDVRKVMTRSRDISSFTFNLNIYSEENCLRDFRFRQQEIPIVSNLMGWTAERTKRSRYRCSQLTACCVVLRRLSYPCRWKDLELVFGMYSSALSEVFWEVLEVFCAGKGHLISVRRTGLLRERAEQYATALRNKNAPLERCVGFIDCTKIEMACPGEHGSLQRAVYSGHKRFHCLIYQTLTTPDGLIFSFFGPEVGRRHDTTLLRQSVWNEILQECSAKLGKKLGYTRGVRSLLSRQHSGVVEQVSALVRAGCKAARRRNRRTLRREERKRMDREGRGEKEEEEGGKG